jgi:hypothetical protein
MSGYSEKALVFYSKKNEPGRVDATGAFIPEAKAFKRYYGIPDENFIGVDCTKGNKPANRRDLVLGEISKREGLQVLAFFGHGFPHGIKFGLTLKYVDLLVANLRAEKDLKIGLYACLAAENDVRDTNVKGVGPGTDGGFADMLRDEMVRVGITDGWVDGHKTAGHTSWNPNVVRFLCEDVDDPEYGAEGGAYIVAPRSKYWKKWCRALKDNKSGFRYSFMTKTEFEIKKSLEVGNIL